MLIYFFLIAFLKDNKKTKKIQSLKTQFVD